MPSASRPATVFVALVLLGVASVPVAGGVVIPSPGAAASSVTDATIATESPAPASPENGTAVTPLPPPPNGTMNGSANVTITALGGDAYRIDVGDGDPGMVVFVNLSLFGNLPGPGALRFASYGSMDRVRVVQVDLALVFDGVGDAGSFFANPFSRFSAGAEWSLHLPFLAEVESGPTGASA